MGEPGQGSSVVRDPWKLIDLINRLLRCPDLAQLLGVGAREIGRLMAVDECAFLQIREGTILGSWQNLPLPNWPEAVSWGLSEFQLDDFPFLQKTFNEINPVQTCREGGDEAEDVRNFLDRLDAAACLLIPFALNHQAAGWILLTDKKNARTFDEDEIIFGLLLARHMSLAIEHVQLRRDSKQREAELEAVLQAGLSLTASLELQEVLDNILKTTMLLIPGSESAHMFIQEKGRLRFAVALWAEGRKTAAFAEPRKDGLTYTVAQTGETLLVQDMQSHPLYANAPSEWTGSIIGLPLKIRDRVVGVMNVANRRVDAFTPNDLRILGMLADQAAIVVENARLHELVKEQAETDILTGLNNRRALNRRLDLEMQWAKRFLRPYTLVMLDLDNFKQVNDRYGHPEGDRVLKIISTYLQNVVRETDFLARYGGDEFAIVSAETDAEAGNLQAERILEAISKHSIEHPGSQVVRFTFSIGLATYPDDADNNADLLLVADQALYQAKSTGVGQIVRASELPALEKP